MSPQRRIFRKRLNIKDIKDGSTEEVIVKSIDNVSLTDNVSTTNVDKADIFAMLEVFSKTGGKLYFDHSTHNIAPVQHVVSLRGGGEDIDDVV